MVTSSAIKHLSRLSLFWYISDYLFENRFVLVNDLEEQGKKSIEDPTSPTAIVSPDSFLLGTQLFISTFAIISILQ